MLDKFLPPTDNLYKFISISGLLLIFLSSYPYYLNYKLTEQRVEYIRNDRIWSIEMDNLSEELDSIKSPNEIENKLKKYADILIETEELLTQLDESVKKKDNENTKNLTNKILENQKTSRKLSLELSGLETKLLTTDERVKLRERTNQLSLKNVDLKASEELILYYQDEIFHLKLISAFLFLLGLSLAGTGFYFWYTRIQKINDKILLNQAQKESKSNSEKTEEPEQIDKVETE